MRSKVTLMTAVFVLAFGILFSFAQSEKLKAMKLKKGVMGIPDLTTDQISKIQKLKIQHQKEVLPLKTKLKIMQLELQTLILENSDQQKMNAKVEEMEKVRTELHKKRIAHCLAIRNLLTDEQKVYFDARRRFGEGFKGMHSHKGVAKFKRRFKCCK